MPNTKINPKLTNHKLTLVGSTTSPYVRKLRIFMNYNKINYNFKSINYLEANDGNYLKKINPINKIPFLLIDDSPLFDSRIIYNFLTLPEEFSLEKENLISEIDGLLETMVSLFSLRRGGVNIYDNSNHFLLRQHERIELILNALKPWLLTAEAKAWNYPSMSLFSVLEWGHFREMIDLSKYPEFENFVQLHRGHKEVEETKIIVPV